MKIAKLGDLQLGYLGLHPNDRMFSFYVASPAGVQVEVGLPAR
jgi:hypothetical protein